MFNLYLEAEEENLFEKRAELESLILNPFLITKCEKNTCLYWTIDTIFLIEIGAITDYPLGYDRFESKRGEL